MDKLTNVQFEAILWAMFGIENEIQHLEYLLSTETARQEGMTNFLAMELQKRREHFEALKQLIEGGNNNARGLN